MKAQGTICRTNSFDWGNSSHFGIHRRQIYKFINRLIKMGSYDFVIIGAGGSGLAGAMYAARLGLKTLVLGATHGTKASVGGVIKKNHIFLK